MSLPAKKPPLTTKNPKKTLNSRWLLLLLLIVIVVGIGVLLYRNHQTNLENERAFQADKARFAQVEKDMQIAYDAMATISVPIRNEKSESCSRTSLKFSEGDLSCGISRQLVYGSESYKQAVQQLDKFAQRLNELSFVEINDSKQINNLRDKDSAVFSSEQHISVGLNWLEGGQCSIDLTTYTPVNVTQYSYIKTQKAAVYNLSCIKSIKQPIYPLAE